MMHNQVDKQVIHKLDSLSIYCLKWFQISWKKVCIVSDVCLENTRLCCSASKMQLLSISPCLTKDYKKRKAPLDHQTV